MFPSLGEGDAYHKEFIEWEFRSVPILNNDPVQFFLYWNKEINNPLNRFEWRSLDRRISDDFISYPPNFYT